MKKFVSILTVVIFSLALLPMLSPSEAATGDLFIQGGHGGQGGITSSTTNAFSGGGGVITSGEVFTAADPQDENTGKTGEKDAGYEGTGFNAYDGRARSVNDHTGNGGDGGSVDIRIASRVVASLDITGGDGGADNNTAGGVGGDAGLTVTTDLTVNGVLGMTGGTGTTTSAAGGVALLKVGKLTVSNDVKLARVDGDSAKVSFDVAEMIVGRNRVVSFDHDFGGVTLTSDDVKILALTLSEGSNFKPKTSVDLKEVYRTATVKVDGKNAKLTSVDFKMVATDTLTFNIAGVGSGDTMLFVAGGSPVDIKSADVAKVTLMGGPPASRDKGTRIKLIAADSGIVIVSKDFPNGLTYLSPDSRTPSRPTSFEFSVEYVGNEMIAVLERVHRPGGGSSGCSAVGFAPFAILLILGAATFGKRK